MTKDQKAVFDSYYGYDLNLMTEAVSAEDILSTGGEDFEVVIMDTDAMATVLGWGETP